MKPATASLDTLAQLITFPEAPPKQEGKEDRTLLSRAKAKFITNTLVFSLLTVKDSPLKKAYWNTYHCAETIEQKGKTLKTKYCKNRWCMVCNRIRTAIQIKGYEPALKAMQDCQFVTLTFPNVPGENLRQEIVGMYEKFRRINRRLAKRGVKLKGLRKLECTYNPITGHFNPHYHLLMEGQDHARILVAEWLKEYPTAKPKAQKISIANDNTIMELMKYFTKILPSKASRASGKVEINPKALDTMFRAMQGLRVFQPFGIAKHVTEEIEDLDKQEYDILERDYAIYIWEQSTSDWLDFISFAPLTGYQPEDNTMNLIEIIQDRRARDKPG